VTFAASCLTDSRSAQGWTSTAYIDVNGNGTLEVGTDTLVVCGTTTLNLAVGETRAMFVRVFAPGSATAADPANVTTLAGTYGASTTSVTDSTSVTDGLVLLKEQAPVGCAAAGPHAGYTTGAIPAGPATAPGQCIAYRITATYRLNGLNKPKVDIDRRSGRIQLKAQTDFSGQCDIGNWGEGHRRF
jgi:hypothetical protein